MISLALGTAWQHEDTVPRVRDGLRLEVDGLNIIPRAENEDLQQVMTRWVSSVQTLHQRRSRFAQLSLEHAHLELCFTRTEGTVLVQVLEGRGLHWSLICTCSVDFEELREAVLQAARGLQKALAARHLDSKELQHQLQDTPDTPVVEPIVPQVLILLAADGLQLTLSDVDGALQSFSPTCSLTMFPLLVPGMLIEGDVPPHDSHPLLPLLAKFQRTPDPALTEFVHRLCTVLFASFPSLLQHPILRQAFELSLPSTARTRGTLPVLSHDTAPAMEASAPLTPLGTPSRLRMTLARRLELPSTKAWDALHVVQGWQVATSAQGVAIAGPRSTAARVIDAINGTAVVSTGALFISRENELLMFHASKPSALWRRNNVSLSLLTPAYAFDALFVLRSTRGFSGHHSLTGAEQWHWQSWKRLRQVLQSGPTLIAVSDHEVTALRARDGHVEWKLATGATLARPVHDGVLLVSSGPDTSLFEVLDGRDPVPLRKWERDGHCLDAVARNRELWALMNVRHHTVLVAFKPDGKLRFERQLPVNASTARLHSTRSGMLVTDASGAAVRMKADGTVQWVLGALGDTLNRPVRSVEARKMSVIAGTTVRLIDSEKGTLLGQIEPRAHLVDMAVDARAAVSLLTPTALELWKPTGTLVAV